MEIAEEDLDKTTFVAHRGAFRWPRMLLGPRNASSTFQLSLDLMLSGVHFKTFLVYLDDVMNF